MAQHTSKQHTVTAGRAGLYMLIICLIAIACTTTLPQRIAGMTNPVNYSFAEVLSGGLTACLLIVLAIAWFLTRSTRKDVGYRLSWVEPGLLVFIIAGLIGIWLASDKRAAVNHLVFLAAPVFMAILLVQVMDSAARVKILLYTIVALGVVNTYECASQYYESNETMVQEYDKDPDAMLARIGITKGTYEQMMFEYHLKSKDVRGYFTTSNSAGSFMLLAVFAAIALVAEGYGSFKAGRTTSGEMLGKCIVLVAVAWGLWLTQSKGAIGSAAIALVLLGVWRICHSWLGRHRQLVVAFIIVCVLGIAAGIMIYGHSHGTLPGGKSMMVRWQYWIGAARMYADHPLGIGGGNFYAYYPQYKIPAAPETVKDPHNFVLAILTQYGPLGLLGFLGTLMAPLWLATSNLRKAMDAPTPDSAFPSLCFETMLIVCMAMLAIRPLVMSFETGAVVAVALFVIAMLFVLPVVLVVATFFLTSTREFAGPFGSGTKAILLCGIVGVLVHGCIDFAIFEPGVLMTLWACIAAVVAIDFIDGIHTPQSIVLGGSAGKGAWAGTAAIAAALAVLVVIPTSRAEYYLERADAAIGESDLPLAHSMFAAASKADPLSPEPCYENGRLYMFDYRAALTEPNVAENAERAFAEAIARDPQYYKYRGKMAEARAAAAENARGDERTALLERAYAGCKEAIARYPGEASLHVSLGDIADKLGRTQEAMDEYKRAVAIEDDYRRLFKVMYPDRQPYSRLDEKEYQWARTRIVELGAKGN